MKTVLFHIDFTWNMFFRHDSAFYNFFSADLHGVVDGQAEDDSAGRHHLRPERQRSRLRQHALSSYYSRGC